MHHPRLWHPKPHAYAVQQRLRKSKKNLKKPNQETMQITGTWLSFSHGSYEIFTCQWENIFRWGKKKKKN